MQMTPQGAKFALSISLLISLLFLCADAPPACGGGPPAANGTERPSAVVAKPDAETQKKLAECARLWQEAERAAAAGKLNETVELIQQTLVIQREVFGDEHLTVANMWAKLAEVYEMLGKLTDAEEARRKVQAIHSKLYGVDDWRTVNARLALNQVGLLKRLSTEERAELNCVKQLNQQIRKLWQAGAFAEAVKLTRQAMEIQQRLLGETHPDYASSLNNLAMFHQKSGDYERAETLFQKSLDIKKKTLGEVHPDYAVSLNNLALLYQELGNYARAEPLYQQALEITKKTLGESHPNYAGSLSNLAAIYQEMADYSRAEPLFRRALEIKKKALGDAHPSYVVSMNNLARLYQEMADYARAEPLYWQVIEISKKVLGEKHPDYALYLSNFAILYEKHADYGRAESLYRQALEIYKETIGEDHPKYATSLNNLAGLYQQMADYSRAEALYQQALEVYKRTLAEGHSEYAKSLSNLGGLYREMADYARAESLCRQALEITKKTLGKAHPSYAISLSNLANLYQDKGDYARAEPLYRQTLEITKQALGDVHPSYAVSLNNLAGLYRLMADYARAEPLFVQALEINKRALGESHPSYAISLNNPALVYEEMADRARAEPFYRRALEIKMLALGDAHPDYAVSLNNLGGLYQAGADYERAEPLCRQALEIFERTLGEKHPDYATTLMNFGTIYVAMGDYGRGEPMMSRAIETLDALATSAQHRCHSFTERAKARWSLGRQEEALEDLTHALALAEIQRAQASGGEQERGQLFATFQGAYATMVAWQAELGHSSEAFAAAEHGRARSLVDQLAAQGIDLLADVPATEAQKLRERDAAAQRLVTTAEKQLEVLVKRIDLSASQKQTTARELRTQLATARDELIAVYRDMRTASPAYRLAVGRDYQPLALPDLQTWVTEQNGLLLEYVIGSKSSHVFVVPASGDARVEKLTFSEEQAKALGVEPGDLTSEKLAAAWQLGSGNLGDALTNPHAADRDGGDLEGRNRGLTLVTEALGRPDHAASATQRLALLWQVLIPPSARAVITSASCQRLFVVPDGLLVTLPFEVLVVEGGPQPKYLLDVGPPIVYAPSATVLVNLARKKSPATERVQQQHVLSVANPTYGGQTPDSESTPLASAPSSRYWSGAGQLQPLPNTDQESKWVVEVFQQRGIKSEALRDRSATEAAARLNSPGREILHFACHGLVDQMYGNFFGALALTPGKSESGAADDGFLTLAEIYGLPLDGCELAILSACQTNVGLQQRGEGLYGLSRGFLVAGARRVVASNWLVDDEAAAMLVSVFCSAIAKSKEQKEPVDHAAALHAAKKRIRQNEKWQSPYYWGAFVLIGPP